MSSEANLHHCHPYATQSAPPFPLPQDHWRKEWKGSGHKERVERVYCCAQQQGSGAGQQGQQGQQGHYITGGRSGQIK